MENKINIAEILKDCPKGMELDCVLFEDIVIFDELEKDNAYPITIRTQDGEPFYFTREGYAFAYDRINAKCVIFPKGKTTWEGFHRPFKDGDIVVHTQNNRAIISIIKGEEFKDKSIINPYCILWDRNEGLEFDEHLFFMQNETRLATKEEKQKLFDAIKDNGYKWNPENKTLEKLVEPKFKVGDKIEKCGYRFTIKEITGNYYLTLCGNKIPIVNQDDFTLVPNKFDIYILKPFDKVLVRNKSNEVWIANLYSHYRSNSDTPFIGIGLTELNEYSQCIPYKDDTKHLLGTDDDCDEFYKTWE